MKKKENIVIIVALIIMVLAIIGVSYAAFNYSGLGSKVNTITTGAIKMTYTEDDNIISMSGALPTTDKTGKVRLNPGEYFDFTVSSEITGNVNINYEISAKDVTTSDRKIDGSNIKLYLTRLTDDGEEELMTPETYNEESSANDYTGRPAGEMSLYTSSMNSSESNRYRLRMYVTEEYNPQGDGGGLQFSVQVNVYGKDGDKMPVTTGPTNEVLLSNIPKDNQYDDGVDTFITGEDPNNYIWYSGKLWRAVSVNNDANTTKLVTQWNISVIPFSNDSTAFKGSYIEDWLNDTSVDGFLGNLRDYENFIVTNAKWNATLDATSLGSITRPRDDGTVVTDAVGLLNIYEYQSSNNGGTNGYLNNGLEWVSITPYQTSNYYYRIYPTGTAGAGSYNGPASAEGIRPTINLKSNIRIVDGNGTEDNPYRLEGDNDANLSGTLLSTRYSGEYIKFGTGENTLYRIVSHENGIGTKITSAEPLKNEGIFVTSAFSSSDSEVNYSNANKIGMFLNDNYLNPNNGYLTSENIAMIEDNTTWYLGTVVYNTSYKLAKYTDTNMTSTTSTTTEAKVGLLRLGELMSGQFDISINNTSYWTLTPAVWCMQTYGNGFTRSSYYGHFPTSHEGIKPSMNLKSNIIITSGDGTKNNPFMIELG